MTGKVSFLIFLVVRHFVEANCIWPPPYTINLTHNEEFVLFETLGSDKDDDVYSDEDEMIKGDDIRSFSIARDDAKHFRIHKMTGMLGTPKEGTTRGQYVKWPEPNYEEKHTAWIAGFFVSNGDETLMENSNVFYLNEMAKSVVERKIDAKRQEDFFLSLKREPESSKHKELEYDYTALKAEYVADNEKEKSSNLTLDFVDVKEDESFKESLENIVKIKTPRNCTDKEMNGIGLISIECYWINLRKGSTQSQKAKLVKGILKILLIWLLLYLIIATGCWCQKGWCCCCFQCRFCKPQIRIDEAKKYIAENPVGSYTDGGEVIKYRPSHYEKYAQRRLYQALMKL